ncbi:MAG: hypothetical protein AAGD28_02850 [Bacteroidota bacterium]
MKHKYLSFLICLFVLACESPVSPIPEPGCEDEAYRTQGEKVFSTAFERTQGRPQEAVEKLFGQDNNIGKISSWEGLDLHPLIGEFRIDYQGGTASQRHAIISCGAGALFGPVYCSSGLELMIKNPYIFENGEVSRANVSAQLRGNTCLSQLYSKAQMYLGTNFNYLRSWDQNWEELTITEIWSEPDLEGNYPFSIRVDIIKASADIDAGLIFKFSAIRHDTKEVVWVERAANFPIPVKERIDLEIFIKEGNSEEGEFAVSARVEGEDRIMIFETTNFTHHPNDPTPNGYERFEPFKLATDKELLNYLGQDSRSLKVHWDNWEFWRNKSYF